MATTVPGSTNLPDHVLRGGDPGANGNESGVQSGRPAATEELGGIAHAAEHRRGEIIALAERERDRGGEPVPRPARVDLTDGPGRNVQGDLLPTGEHDAAFGGRHCDSGASPPLAQALTRSERGVEVGREVGEGARLGQVRGDDGGLGYRVRTG